MSKTYTKSILLLPNIERLRTLTQSLALLDAIICRDWDYRYYSFNVHWDINVSVASMRDGSGDHFFAIFTPLGSIVKDFAHEAQMSPYITNPPYVWAGVLEQIPAAFTKVLADPAFLVEDTTFCLWRSNQEQA